MHSLRPSGRRVRIPTHVRGSTPCRECLALGSPISRSTSLTPSFAVRVSFHLDERARATFASDKNVARAASLYGRVRREAEGLSKSEQCRLLMDSHL